MVAMDVLPASLMQNTFGTFITTLLLFGYHCQRAAHFVSVLERYIAITRPDRHKEVPIGPKMLCVIKSIH